MIPYQEVPLSLTEWKTIIEIVAILVTLSLGIPAALLSYKRWFRPADIGVSLDAVLLLGPGAGKEDHIDSEEVLVTAQLRLYNAGAIPESLTSISVFDLHLSQAGSEVSYTAYVALRPLKMTSRKPDESAKFHLEPIELAHSFVLKSEDQVVLHFLFFPDKGQRFTPQPGELKMKFILEAKTHQRRTLRLEPLERRVTLTEEDVQTLRTSQVLGLPSWQRESC
jgi:hypothetical protein